MTEYYNEPDGERFVDSWATNPIPPRSTWDDLTVSQLLEVKNKFSDRVFSLRNQPTIVTVLNQKIVELDRLIAQRSSQ